MDKAATSKKRQRLGFGYRPPERRLQVMEYLRSAQDPRTTRELCHDLGISIEAHPSKLLHELIGNETLKRVPKTCSVSGQISSGYFIFNDDKPHHEWSPSRAHALKKNLQIFLSDNEQEIAARAGQNNQALEVLKVLELRHA